MKKIFTLLAAVAVSLSAMATSFTFTSESSVNQTSDGYTVTLDKGSGNNAPAFFGNYDPVQMRLYASNTIKVSGSEITSIKLYFAKQGSKEYATLSANPGTLVSGGESTSNTDIKTDEWTGSAQSVTFTLGATGQRIITKIVVNGDGSEDDTPSTPGTPDDPTDNPSTLDPNFEYPEPTVLKTPGTTVQGQKYTFILSNIQVDCTTGAVNADYFSAHAGNSLTFTATKPIKGIVINGMVKKGFEATVDHGKVSYLTPDADTEADPVVVITDINSTSVTLSCVKQLRCFTVEIYFDANPDASVSGGNGGNAGEDVIIPLTFDSAEAIYESEYSEMIGETNYSVFLFNEAEPYVPYFGLDIYPASKDNIAGTYTWDDYSLGDYTYYCFGEGDEDVVWAENGSVTISRSGDTYTIEGWVYCDNNRTYSISFTGKIDFYTDDEYYGDGGGDDEDAAVSTVISEEGNVQMYDLNGHKVRDGFRGIFIRNGKKYVGR